MMINQSFYVGNRVFVVFNIQNIKLILMLFCVYFALPNNNMAIPVSMPAR